MMHLYLILEPRLVEVQWERVAEHGAAAALSRPLPGLQRREGPQVVSDFQKGLYLVAVGFPNGGTKPLAM